MKFSRSTRLRLARLTTPLWSAHDKQVVSLLRSSGWAIDQELWGFLCGHSLLPKSKLNLANNELRLKDALDNLNAHMRFLKNRFNQALQTGELKIVPNENRDDADDALHHAQPDWWGPAEARIRRCVNDVKTIVACIQ